MKPTIPELVEKLAAQGDANQIALHLEQEGVQGQRSSAVSCVVSKYLQRESGLDYINVVPECVIDGLHVGGVVRWWDEGWVEHNADLPEELTALANSFDRGDFPALDRNSER